MNNLGLPKIYYIIFFYTKEQKEKKISFML